MKQITETRVKWSCPEIAKDMGGTLSIVLGLAIQDHMCDLC